MKILFKITIIILIQAMIAQSMSWARGITMPLEAKNPQINTLSPSVNIHQGLFQTYYAAYFNRDLPEKNSDQRLELIKGVTAVFHEPKGAREIKFSTGEMAGANSYGVIGDEVIFQGKHYYAKYAKNDIAEKRYIIPQAKICKLLNEKEIKGVYTARHFVEFESKEGRKRKAILFDMFPEGETLDEIIRWRGRIPEDKALAIIIKVARVVKSLHDIGVYHYDIKPGNIYVTADGAIILFDFDLLFAKQEDFLERKLWQIGSIFFVSNNRLRLSKEKEEKLTKRKIKKLLANHQSEDVFSLLATLTNMLIGDNFFECFDETHGMRDFDEAASRLKHCYIESTISKWLYAMLVKALKTEKSQFKTVDEFIQRLHRYMGNNNSYSLPDWLNTAGMIVIKFLKTEDVRGVEQAI